MDVDSKCSDGSSEIKEAQGGDCGRELMCTAKSRKLKNQKVCVKEKYKCDQVVHCEGGEDEANCTQEDVEENSNDYYEYDIALYGGNCLFIDGCDKAYLPPAGGHCEKMDDLMCTARDGRLAGWEICVEKKFQCDNYLQCEDGKDEEGCEEEYTRKKLFKRDHDFICKIPFLKIKTEKNTTSKFFPMRAIRCARSSSLSSHINPCRSGATRSPSVLMVRMKRVARYLKLLVLS